MIQIVVFIAIIAFVVYIGHKMNDFDDGHKKAHGCNGGE